MGTVLLQGLRTWLSSVPLAPPPAPGSGATRSAVADARNEFLAMLADLQGSGEIPLLRERIRRAASLRELWHLRADVFSAVALQRNQSEAEDRLGWLNRWFPTRAPRSGFGALSFRATR
jgi:hypothetical protein